jgi:hypothetical protein
MTTSLTDLTTFRKRAYTLLGNGRDSLFDLMDAVLTTRSVPSFAELSLSPMFRRQWSSLYKGLERHRCAGNTLLPLYGEQVCPGPSERVILAGDHTAWPRLWSPTLKERTYEHHPVPHPGAHPVTLGQGYSTLAWVPEAQGSWALPLLHERISSFESPLTQAAAQLRQVTAVLAQRPVSLWDAEYGCARFVQLTADIEADKVMRLRSNRVLYGPPPAYAGRGRPRKHGAKFKLHDSSTWWPATETQSVIDERFGQLRLRSWSNLHFYATPAIAMHLMLVERLDAHGQRTHRPLWLIAIGDHLPPLAALWPLYLRRFCVDHWYRFIKQRLHWCLPHLATAEQSDRWSHLMPLMTWQLWLARHQTQHCLPWQKPMPQPSPGRVANAFAPLLAVIATPASPPKPRGKSPGWPMGQQRQSKPRFPTVRKRYVKPKKTETDTT